MDERVTPAPREVETAPLTRGTPPRARQSMARRLIIPLIVIIAAGGGAAWWWETHRTAQSTGSGAAGRGAQTAAQPVGAATIDTGDIRIILNELGIVTPLANVTIKTQINGQLIDVGFKEGQLVNKGDFLAQIDQRPYQVALEQAQGLLAHDTGLLQQAQTNLKRFQLLGKQDSIAQQQIDDQRFLVVQDQGSVQSDQAQIDSAKLNIAYCHIVSPVTGRVGLRLVDPGNYVQTSDANGLLVVTQLQPISVIFTVTEDNLPQIMQRLHAGATLTVAAYDRSNTTQLSTGEVSTVDNQIDTTTGTVKLRANFANENETLFPNQFVNARLLVDTMQKTVRVPVVAVQQGSPGTYVYVINQDDTVSVRPIQVGPTDGQYSAVTSGLKAGERVVTDGTDRLRDGAKVTIPPPTPAAATTTPGGQERRDRRGTTSEGPERAKR